MPRFDMVPAVFLLLLSIAFAGCHEQDDEFDGIPDPRGLECGGGSLLEVGRTSIDAKTQACDDYSIQVAANLYSGVSAARSSGLLRADTACRTERLQTAIPVLLEGDSEFSMCRVEMEAIIGRIDNDAYVVEHVVYTSQSDPCWTESCTWRRRQLYDTPKTTFP